VKINNKIKVLNVNKLIFLQDQICDADTEMKELNFNFNITLAHAKLIKYKDRHCSSSTAQEGESQAEIDSLCDGTCPTCDSKNDFQVQPATEKIN